MILALCPGAAFGAAAVGTASSIFGDNYISVDLTSSEFPEEYTTTSEASDTTPPQFIEDYPRAGVEQAAGSRQVQIVFNADESGNYYYVILPISSPQPTAQQIRDHHKLISFIEGVLSQSIGSYSIESGAEEFSFLTQSGTLADDTTYAFYMVLEDAQGNLGTVARLEITTPPADTTPPAFEAGKFPTNNPQRAGSRQIYIYFTAQEPAYYHAVLLPDGATAPSKEQVAAGKDASGNPAIRAFNNSSKQTVMTIAGFVPLHGTDYDVYVVLRDDAGNLSDPAMVDFPSPPPADLLAPGYPAVGDVQPDGSKQVQIKVKMQNIDEERQGRVYWVLLPDGASPPTIEQVAAGTDGNDTPAISSGSPEFSGGSEETFLVTGAAEELRMTCTW